MTSLEGVRVFVVEDECAVAMLIEGMLEELGCVIVASAGSLAQAQCAASAANIDVAMLDVNLGGAPVFPLARTLRERAIPILFSTGYGEAGRVEEFANCEVITKPFSLDCLRDKMKSVLAVVSEASPATTD